MSFTAEQLGALRELQSRRSQLRPEQVAALDELSARAGITDAAAEPAPRRGSGVTGGWGPQHAPETQPRSVAGFAANIPKSAGNLVESVAHAVTHPVDTLKAVGQAAVGGLQTASTALGAADPADRGLDDYRGQFDGVMSALKERYGSLEAVQKTAYEDPVGFLLDASAVFTGGAGVARRAGMASAADVLGAAARAADPIAIAGKVAKPIAKVGGEVAVQALGKTTGVGAEAVHEAAKAAPEFKSALRGASNHESIADDVVKAAEVVADQRRTQYQTQLANLPKNISLPMTPVQAAMKSVLDDFGVSVKNGKLDFSNSKGFTDEASQKKLLDTYNDVKARAGKRLSASDMDTLKQRLSSRIGDGVGTQADAAITRVFDRSRTVLEQMVPGYADMTRDYAEASGFLRQVRSELSTGGNKGTQVRKIAAAYNQRNGYRGDLLDELGRRTGRNFKASNAGADMASYTPRGLMGTVAGASGVAAFSNPALLAGLPLTSPRLVGELLIALSKMKGVKIDPRAVDPRTVRAVSASGELVREDED